MTRLSPSPRLARLLLSASFLLVAACGGTTEGVGPDAPGEAGDAAAAAEEPATPGGDASADAGEDGANAGARVTVALRGTTSPVPHADGFEGQTPQRQIIAVTSLWLYRSASDAAPVKVFDLGTAAVETDLVSGKTSEIAQARLGSLAAGTFTQARVGVAYVRYSVAARMHNGISVDGRYDNVQALSEGAVIDGSVRGRGWYRYAFAVGSTTYGALEGAAAPLPASPSMGGLSLDTSGPQAFYVFPTAITIDPTEANDQRVVCEVNVHESFRWQDQSRPGFAGGIFDTTPSSFEPVMRFGANALALLREAK